MMTTAAFAIFLWLVAAAVIVDALVAHWLSHHEKPRRYTPEM